ncbi:hypothetical protein [Microbacterium sp. WCS2018Hpa-9]|uniref:hypothetical protein n=1 Tax=Microbacterium sp. WCS2018Hpa-9 TaxID=3073635 RepID=UPI00288B38AA|nr:hypothetical protein [Microbacterium sp. WCS2018Hpa-9]
MLFIPLVNRGPPTFETRNHAYLPQLNAIFQSPDTAQRTTRDRWQRTAGSENEEGEKEKEKETENETEKAERRGRKKGDSGRATSEHR